MREDKERECAELVEEGGREEKASGTVGLDRRAFEALLNFALHINAEVSRIS